MANYAVTDYVTPPMSTAEEVTALLETEIEKHDTANTIRLLNIKKMGSMFVGILIYDT